MLAPDIVFIRGGNLLPRRDRTKAHPLFVKKNVFVHCVRVGLPEEVHDLGEAAIPTEPPERICLPCGMKAGTLPCTKRLLYNLVARVPRDFTVRCLVRDEDIAVHRLQAAFCQVQEQRFPNLHGHEEYLFQKGLFSWQNRMLPDPPSRFVKA